MQNKPNNQWIDAVAKLTLAQSLIWSVLVDIDRLESELDHQIESNKRLAEVVLSGVKELEMAASQINSVQTELPQLFLDLEFGKQQKNTRSFTEGINAKIGLLLALAICQTGNRFDGQSEISDG